VRVSISLTCLPPVGLCITLVLEIGLIKVGADDIDKQFWVMSKVFLIRMVFLGVATVQILHSIFTYRYVTNTALRKSARLHSGSSEFSVACWPKPLLQFLTCCILQGLRSAEPPAAPDAGGEGPGAGGDRRRAGTAVRDGGERGEHERLLVGLRRAGGRGGQQDGPELRDAARAGAPALQRGRVAGGVRRELHHDVGGPEVQSAAAEIGRPELVVSE
jgi:hypothetical protein